MAEVLKSAFISDDIVHIGTVTAIPVEAPAVIAQHEIEDAYNNGFKQGIAEARAQMKELKDAISALLQSIPAAVEDNRLHLSTEIADIVLLITQRFFIHQQQNKDAITNQITQTLNQLNQKQNIELALHPHDIALLQQGELNIDFKPYKNIRITPDETLHLGGCVIRSEHGVFDAGIERQIDSLKQVLLKKKQILTNNPGF